MVTPTFYIVFPIKITVTGLISCEEER